jgi:hypothetical protein
MPSNMSDAECNIERVSMTRLWWVGLVELWSHIFWERIRNTWSGSWPWTAGWSVFVSSPAGIYQLLEPISPKALACVLGFPAEARPENHLWGGEGQRELTEPLPSVGPFFAKPGHCRIRGSLLFSLFLPLCLFFSSLCFTPIFWFAI